MNKRNNPKYLFGKVGLSKKTYIKTNIGLRMKEKSIDEDFDITNFSLLKLYCHYKDWVWCLLWY